MLVADFWSPGGKFEQFDCVLRLPYVYSKMEVGCNIGTNQFIPLVIFSDYRALGNVILPL